MPNKLFLKTNELYEAPNKRLQDDVEITGATITHTNGRISAITFGGGGGAVDFSTLQSFDSNSAAVAVMGAGALYKSSTLSVNGSPQILITV